MVKTTNKKKEKLNSNNTTEQEEGCSAITFSQQRRILKNIEDEKYYNFFYFCCCTGMRVCEALSIKTKDINKRKNVIKINLKDSKTKKHKREVPFVKELFKNISLKDEYLFNDITDEGSKQYFYCLYKKLNLPLSRHSARHTFVSICTHIKIEPEIIQGWVGHTNLKMTTDTYTHDLKNGTSEILAYLKKLKTQTKPQREKFLKQTEKHKKEIKKSNKLKTEQPITKSKV